MAGVVQVHAGPDFNKPLPTDSLGVLIYNSFIDNANKNDVLFINGQTNESLTYQSLFESTCRLAVALKQCGLKANDVIAIFSENNLNFFHPIVSALYLGLIIAPINPAYIADELLHVLHISEPTVVFCTKETYRQLLNVKEKCNFIKMIILLDENDETVDGSLFNFINKHCDKYYDEYTFKPVAVNLDEQTAAIMCSSGTTGLPKGVMLTHKNLIIRLAHEDDDRLHPKDKNIIKLAVLPLFHAYGLVTTLGAIIRKETVVILTKFEGDTFLNCIQKYKITNLFLVPPIILFLEKYPLIDKYDLSSVKEIICGAAPLSENVEESVKKRLKVPAIRQGYGLTETTLAVILTPPDQSKYGSSGKVVPGAILMIKDLESDKPLGPNKVGEVCVKGPLLMKGYYKNPEATRACYTKDGWFQTGDLAYYDADGFFFIVDRLKELIKYKGYQVAPAELEALLLQHSKIKDAAVIGFPNEQAGELPLAFVVKQPNVQLDEKEVQDYVKERVSSIKHLRGGVRFVESIPKNPSGKILRRKLRELILKDCRSKL